ncbi:MAG: hypothetical protein P1Q69_12315, partial [Candidatus Thorarchaeota archaeon]|nr:hypothetical protein [Candidatus Thorarchaeota archaeon]
VCDLNEHDPNAPTLPPPTQDPPPGVEPTNNGPDGTTSGTTLQPATTLFIENALALVAQCIIVWWTGYWPKLHFEAKNPTNQAVLLHMSVDILGVTEVYSSNSAGSNEGDFWNAVLSAAFKCSMGLWAFALLVACIVAENAVLGAISAVVLTVIASLAYAWIGANLLVENGISSAGGMAVYFWILGVSYLAMAAGLKGVGNITSSVLSRILGYLLGITEEAMKAALKFTRATKIIFIMMGLVFIGVFFPYFLNYGS